MATRAHTDYYATLGVPPDADRDGIHAAFRSLARRYHPDRNPSPGAQERFKEIAEAYAVLSDPDRRAAYDREGAAAHTTASADDLLAGLDLADLLARAGMAGFGDGDPFRGGFLGEGPTAMPLRGQDLEVGVTVPLDTVLTGGTADVTVRRPARCRACDGTGAAAGARPGRCAACGGTGRRVTERRRGALVMRRSAACPACGGTGRTAGPPCPGCGGIGRVAAADSVTVRIPRGIAEGAVLRLRGRGMPPPAPGGAPGDAYVTVRTAADPRFVRQGAELWHGVEVSVPDAVLGTVLTVPALDGEVSLALPPGTQPGTILRVPGRGLPLAGTHDRGDLRVSVTVRVPDAPSGEERRLYGLLRTGGGAAGPAEREETGGRPAGPRRRRWWPWRRRASGAH
ncbi:DnaJ C-terminal domain-containing protein [Kitasatospora sp. NPDC059571]|uniref:DnaJ C-terminal domain-containing protein n=1 Tax=Kitasatospora sp. NPDC059571 TaxID=3346871 RepID=UPI0036D1D0B8